MAVSRHWRGWLGLSRECRKEPVSHTFYDASSPLVVGIGASAGGLDAFKKFFTAMPADSGMAFVLVQHLDPNHKSLLVDLLSSQTKMPVIEAGDGVRVTGNSVFVIPRDATLTIKNGVLRLTTPAPPRDSRRPIDTFFTSLAEDQGENAVCIVLSGTGSDGTAGVRAMREYGGLILAQAEFDHHALPGMPDSAAATGLVDQILPVEALPARLLEHRNHLVAVAATKNGDGTRSDTIEHLATITAILRRGVTHDFAHYKQSTLVRRVQRRMQVLQIGTAPAYIERLQKDPGEVELLFRDILIGVTQFFRDPEAFLALQNEVIPKLFAGKGPTDQVRVWVPGCATGEEVYSIAILMKEAMARHDNAPHVQIFGTDIDDRAIAAARTGRYSGDLLGGVSTERRERWFVPAGDDFCLAKEIREMCVFSVHSLAKDPPFSRLNLISCRNLMIYFDTALQDRVIRNFHYSLVPGGYLFLGPSESLSRNALLFTALDKKQRIYQSRKSARATTPDFPLAPSGAVKRLDLPKNARTIEERIEKSARAAVANYSPAYFVVDQDYQVLRFSGAKTGQYLEPSAGAASLDLFTILKKSLRRPVRAALQTARAKRTAVIEDDLTVTIDGERRLVSLIVEPLLDEFVAESLCLVAFRDTGPARNAAPPAAASQNPAATDVDALERELAAAKAMLRGTVDELETTSEEMKSSNEEFQSVNEELQASNEELETAKEEMQSVNEELQTINSEMIAKNETLIRLNSDLSNLLDSTQIATIFLDSELRIKNFTPCMLEIVRLREVDRGRPITDIVSHLNYVELAGDIEIVLRTLTIVDREVRIPESGMVFDMRIRPYRTVTNVVDGVVITFVDVTERKRLEEDRARLAAIVTSSNDAVIGHALDGTIVSWNKAAEGIFGYTASEAIGKPLTLLLPAGWPYANADLQDRLIDGDLINHFEEKYAHKNGTTLDVSVTVSAVRDAAGTLIGASTIARDIRDRKAIEVALKTNEQRLAAIINQATAGVVETDLDGRFTLTNPLFCEIVGRTASELAEMRMLDITHPDDRAQSRILFDRLLVDGRPFASEKRYLRPNGSAIWVRSTVSSVKNADGRVDRTLAVVLEITEHKRAQAHRDLLMNELAHRVKNTLATVQSIAMQTMNSSTTIEAFRTAFMARLMALSGTHNLLGVGDWHGALLRDVVLAELSPYQADENQRWTVEGGDVLLDANTALAFGMALHELTTNAAKYGALSVPTGHIDTAWRLRQTADGRRLNFTWQESGGPAVKKSREGFGTKLITQGLALQLDGSVELDFDTDGIRCAIEIPLPSMEAVT